jgi:integrase
MKRPWTVTEESAPRVVLEGGRTDQIRFDGVLRHFGVRVRLVKEGAPPRRTYVYQYKRRGRTNRIMCGDVGAIPAKEARKIAEEYEATLLRGGDPAADRRVLAGQRSNTLRNAIDLYLDAMAPKFKENTLRITRSYLLGDHWKKFHPLPLDEISEQKVIERLDAIAASAGPAAANKARNCLSRVYIWARKKRMCTTNPVASSDKQEEKGERDRVLSDDEIAELWQATEGDADYHQVVRLVMLTGCRRDEIGGLQWDEIDLEKRTITIAKERSKNGNAHLVPLCDLALGILRERPHYGDNVFGRGAKGFSSYSEPKRRLDESLKFEQPWVLHDLRRTIATNLQRLG